MAEFSPETKELGDKIVGLTLLKARELGQYLEEVHGIKPAAAAVAVAAGPAGPAAPAAEEKTEFNVILAEVGPKKIQVIKTVRELTNLGLKEAKALVDGAPKPVKEGVQKQEAEEIKKKLEAEGAKVEIK
jgi:large subunit ribosomal protein L7/L12